METPRGVASDEARFWSQLARGGAPVVCVLASDPVVFSAAALLWAVRSDDARGGIDHEH